MKKKLIAFGTAALLVTSLAACGEAKDDSATIDEGDQSGVVVVEEETVVEDMSGAES